MNVKTVMAVTLVCGAAMLSGCASMHSKGDPSALSPAAGNGGHFIQDATYVATVDRQATEEGVQVIWINPPEKRMHD